MMTFFVCLFNNHLTSIHGNGHRLKSHLTSMPPPGGWSLLGTSVLAAWLCFTRSGYNRMKNMILFTFFLNIFTRVSPRIFHYRRWDEHYPTASALTKKCLFASHVLPRSGTEVRHRKKNMSVSVGVGTLKRVIEILDRILVDFDIAGWITGVQRYTAPSVVRVTGPQI